MAKVACAIFKEEPQGEHPLTLERLIEDNLCTLSSSPQDGRSLWVMLESAAQLHFWWFDRNINWADWAAGRIFGPTGELRFWRHGEWVHGVLLTDDDTASLRHFEKEKQLSDRQDGEEFEYLWCGKRGQATDSFIETRLPRDLKYPLPRPTTGPILKVKAYECNGVPEFVRFCEVVSENPKSVKRVGGA